MKRIFEHISRAFRGFFGGVVLVLAIVMAYWYGSKTTNENHKQPIAENHKPIAATGWATDYYRDSIDIKEVDESHKQLEGTWIRLHQSWKHESPYWSKLTFFYPETRFEYEDNFYLHHPEHQHHHYDRGSYLARTDGKLTMRWPDGVWDENFVIDSNTLLISNTWKKQKTRKKFKVLPRKELPIPSSPDDVSFQHILDLVLRVGNDKIDSNDSDSIDSNDSDSIDSNDSDSQYQIWRKKRKKKEKQLEGTWRWQPGTTWRELTFFHPEGIVQEEYGGDSSLTNSGLYIVLFEKPHIEQLHITWESGEKWYEDFVIDGDKLLIYHTFKRQ